MEATDRPDFDPAAGASGLDDTGSVLDSLEARLRQSEERLRAVVANAPIIAFSTDATGVCTFLDGRALHEVGIEADDIVGRSLFELTAHEFPAIAEHLRRALAGETVRATVVARHLAFDAWMAPHREHDGTVTGILGVATNVTERRRMEDELRASEARLKALVQNSSDMIGVIDADRRLVYASPAAAGLAGLAQDMRLDDDVLELVHPEDRQPVLACLADVAAAGRGQKRRLEYRVRDTDGSWRHLDVIVTNLLDDPDVGGLVFNARDITDRRLADLQLAHQAYHDSLTGLPNRALFVDRLAMALARARRRPCSVAVLFLDLDRFKVINDSLGHQAGDDLLVAVSQRLASTLRPSDTVARFEGDEFTVLCEDIVNEHELVTIADRVGRALREPFAVEDREVFLSASIGISVARDAQATPESLLRDADAAVFRAKERGRSRFELFDAGMRARAVERLELENALHRAVDRGELCLHYQPIIDLTSGTVAGAEALLRWQHPTRGMIPPDQFVPLAEETGLIIPIGEWVVTEACRAAGRWRDDHDDRPFSINVNLSAGQLAQPRLAQAVDQAIAEAGIPASSLWFEITETTIMQDAEAAIATLRALKSRGVSLCVDDFGTGYSSMNYLKRLPIDALKVDRSFVSGLASDPDDDAIAQAVVGLAHMLGLEAIAEGVETPRQLIRLRQLGCDGAQGFYFARPGPHLAAEVAGATFSSGPA